MFNFSNFSACNRKFDMNDTQCLFVKDQTSISAPKWAKFKNIVFNYGVHTIGMNGMIL